MDDGSKDRDSFYLNTQQFGLSDQESLLQKLNEIGIKATLNKDKIYYRIRILKESKDRFIELTSPYILPSLKYKILL